MHGVFLLMPFLPNNKSAIFSASLYINSMRAMKRCIIGPSRRGKRKRPIFSVHYSHEFRAFTQFMNKFIECTYK